MEDKALLDYPEAYHGMVFEPEFVEATRAIVEWMSARI